MNAGVDHPLALDLAIASFGFIPYWLLGLPFTLPFVTGEDTNALRLTPAVGCAIAGLIEEWAMLAGVPRLLATCIVLVLAAAVSLLMGWRSARAVLRSILEFLPLYFVAVAICCISPFPVLGVWSGDWLVYYRSGHAILTGNMPVDLLGRPPLFGAGAIPLWLVRDGLPSYQIFCAVASAGLISVMHYALGRFRPGRRHLPLLCLVAITPFILHNSAAAWSKQLAAALLLAGFVGEVSTGWAGERKLTQFVPPVLFALSIGVHQSSLIYLPAIILMTPTRQSGKYILRRTLMYIVLIAVVAGPYELWTISHYGIQAKVAANPVITDRTDLNLISNTALVFVTGFVGWAPVVDLARWVRSSHPLDPAEALKQGFWLLASWVTTMAGTLLGTLGPFLLLKPLHKGIRPSTAGIISTSAGRVILAISSILLLNAVLNPFWSSYGVMQTGLEPLCLIGLLVLIAEAETTGWRFRLAFCSVLLLGTVPWILLNGAVTLGLCLSEGFKARMASSSEGDYLSLIRTGLKPVGLESFPFIQIVAFSLLAMSVLIMITLRRGAALKAEKLV